MCRPPGNRDPLPAEIENCQGYLLRQIELDRAARDLHAGQLRDEAAARRPDRHHAPARPARGAPRSAAATCGLYPLFHPAAALYTPANVEMLRADFARIPALLAPPEPEPEPERVAEEAELQLGLF